MLKLVVLRGALAGQTFSSAEDTVRLGRAEGNDVVLPDEHISSDHARFAVVGDRVLVRDLRSTNGTWLVRDGVRSALSEERGREMTVKHGDVVELGSGDRCVALQLVLAGDADARVFALRRIEDLAPATSIVEKDEGRLKLLYQAQKSIGAATDLAEVFTAIAEACFALVTTATHVTVVLKDDEDAEARGSAAYVPVMTRVRGMSGAPEGPIPVTRSIYRKVVAERAAILAADAASEVSQSESLMGAQIRATMGIPLWKGDDILGILQVDNRADSTVFSPADLEILAVLANNVSLAVANARLVRRLKNAEDRLRKENAFLKGREETRRSGGKGPVEIVGKSAPMRALSGQLDKVVDTRVTVLIEGETGVGKELVASAVHYRSRRREKLFVSQNCAALPENLLESELFGHKKGAFTGAHDDKKGLFEIADGGTLFLDEVTEMPLSLQSKLLRVLQEGEVRPVGATHERRVDVRIVAATNRNLEKEVAEGRFREDLYYRLKVFPLRVPPLRERREDIPPLAEHFLLRFSSEFGRPAAGFTQQAMELLQGYDWPGNVRELQNEVQRLCIQVDPGGFVTPELLSPRVRQVEGMLDRVKPTKGTLKEMMDQVERWLLIEALREHGNNKTACAKSLGITREGLHKKLRSFGL
ncbi:MAG: sigma 54-interacting transcriptional regulator [Myxococcales bacterium]|nr:sigma 54-interacting transcriptional regulator [Myxococcales bacterium]